MQIAEAEKQIEELKRYIDLMENYKAETLEQKAIYLYVLNESVSKVADELNQQGFRIGNRKLMGKDVSDIIRSKPDDQLHEMAKKMFGKNRNKAIGRGWI